MTPDYTYGHTVTKSMQDYPRQERRLDDGDQPGLAARRARLLSSYLLNIANSGADVPDQRQLGPRRGAVDPAGQAVRRARQDEAGGPLPDPVPGARSRRRPDGRASMPPPISGGRWRTSTRWPRCSSRRSRRSTATSRSGAPRTPTWSSRCGPRPSRTPARFYPPDVIKSYEKPAQAPVDRRRRALARGRPPAGPPGDHRQGQEAQRHEEQGRLLRRRRSRARAPA